MLTSLALVFLLGLAAAALCSRIGLPRIIGMLLTGILIGPYVLNWLDDSILSISSELRQMALIIILIKAGLSLDLSDLKKVGRPAVMMACVPASCEILAFFLLAPHILGINRIEAAVMGAVLGAGFMVIFNILVNILIPSAAGQAAIVMPLMVPLADLAGITRQVCVQAYQFGDGLCNLLTPLNAPMMGSLALVGVSYPKYIKYFIKYLLIQFAIAAIVTMVLQTIGWTGL